MSRRQAPPKARRDSVRHDAPVGLGGNGGRVRVIVCGGRRYGNLKNVVDALSGFPSDTIIVHGSATGADRLAHRAARELGFDVEPHPANWSRCGEDCPPGHLREIKRVAARSIYVDPYCPTAGFRRNQEMADAGADLCIAFPGGSGTEDMVRRAEKAGIPVKRIERTTT